jgi:hypothetical protein
VTGRLAFAATLALVLGAGGALAGCGLVREAGPAQDTFATWSATPLGPDPNLARRALEAHSSCRPLPDAGDIRILLQDRRTTATAAFLVAGVNTFGSCLVSVDGSSHGGSGPALAPMKGPISIDDNGNGESNGVVVRQLGGRVAADAAKVEIELDDGTLVGASLGGGWWMAWWPGARFARTVTAFDGGGAEIASLEVPKV